MINLGRFISAIPLAGALLLASCGGGGNVAADNRPASQQSGQGIAVGEPNPNTPPDAAKFTAMARGAACSDVRNRMFLIDQKYVYWDHAGNCADASYAQVLYGADIDKPLCSSADSIAGPRTSCSDESVRALFDTIQNNRDNPDLGLGGSHKVEQLLSLPKEGGSVQFSTLVAESFSAIHGAQNVTIRDEAALAKLWAEHVKGRQDAPAMPKVDFSRDMVLAAFAGYSGACEGFGIARVMGDNASLVVEVQTRDPDPGTACIAVVLSPVHMVTVPRSDAKVQFDKVKAAALAFTELARSTRSLIAAPANHVVRDEASWNALWASHSAEKIAAPKVDFNKFMVIATFAGSQPSGCNATDIGAVSRVGAKIMVDVIHWIPGEAMLCTANIVTPAHIVSVERSDEPVVFSAQRRTLK